MACTTGCRTKSHSSYAECLRDKRPKVSAIDVTAQKKADRSLDRYEQARREGIQPASTRKSDVETAIKVSDQMGQAYSA